MRYLLWIDLLFMKERLGVNPIRGRLLCHIDTVASRSKIAVRFQKTIEAVASQNGFDPWRIASRHFVKPNNERDRQRLLYSQPAEERVFRTAGSSLFGEHNQWIFGL